MSELIADRRLYLTSDRESVVEEDDPRAAFLLVGQGGTVPAAEVARLGLRIEAGRLVSAPEAEDGEAEGAAETEGEDTSPDWPLKTPPAEYLERYPDGPKAALAREILGIE